MSVVFVSNDWDPALSLEGWIFSEGKHHSQSYFSRHAPKQICINGDKHRLILPMAVVVSLLVLLLAELDVQQLVVVSISTSWKLSGDVESRSYEVIRSVQRSFLQGHIVLFGVTTGRQCDCNALCSYCW